MIDSDKIEISASSFQPVVSSPSHCDSGGSDDNSLKTSTLKLSHSFSNNNPSLYTTMMNNSTYGVAAHHHHQLKRSQTLRSYTRPTNFMMPSHVYQQQRNSSFMPAAGAHAPAAAGSHYGCVQALPPTHHHHQLLQPSKFSTISDENELNECSDEVNDSSLLFTPSTTSSSSSSSSPSAIYSNNQLLNGSLSNLKKD